MRRRRLPLASQFAFPRNQDVCGRSDKSVHRIISFPFLPVAAAVLTSNIYCKVHDRFCSHGRDPDRDRKEECDSRFTVRVRVKSATSVWQRTYQQSLSQC